MTVLKADEQLKKPHQILTEMVEFLEKKGIPDKEIFSFLDDVEKAAQAELALKIAQFNRSNTDKSEISDVEADTLVSAVLMGYQNELFTAFGEKAS